MRGSGEQYERAFEGWLSENQVPYVPVDQARRRALARVRIKTFDFLLYPRAGGPIVAELKGRRFAGASLAGLRGLECWVTLEDIRGLMQWQEFFAAGDKPARAAFVFAYHLARLDVECDGREVYDGADGSYLFLAVGLEDYQQHMTRRSGKWQTVTLPAARFRRVAIPIGRLLGLDGQESAGDRGDA